MPSRLTLNKVVSSHACRPTTSRLHGGCWGHACLSCRGVTGACCMQTVKGHTQACFCSNGSVKSVKHAEESATTSTLRTSLLDGAANDGHAVYRLAGAAVPAKASSGASPGGHWRRGYLLEGGGCTCSTTSCCRWLLSVGPSATGALRCTPHGAGALLLQQL